MGLGPAQSFSRTVTIDAGARAGLRPDMTVINNDGLVGRILRVTRTTATVLLIVDTESVVGGRVGGSMEVGFLHGRGVLGGDGRLDLELVDQSVVPAEGDTVVTFGSDGGAPYVAGIPVGKVTSVYTSLRETSQRAVIDPFVDFASLDLVGVVVPSGTRSDRAVIEADGGCEPVSALRARRGLPRRLRWPWSSRSRSSRTSPGRASCRTSACWSSSAPR